MVYVQFALKALPSLSQTPNSSANRLRTPNQKIVKINNTTKNTKLPGIIYTSSSPSPPPEKGEETKKDQDQDQTLPIQLIPPPLQILNNRIQNSPHMPPIGSMSHQGIKHRTILTITRDSIAERNAHARATNALEVKDALFGLLAAGEEG